MTLIKMASESSVVALCSSSFWSQGCVVKRAVLKKKKLFPYVCAGEKGLHSAAPAEGAVCGDVPEEGFQGLRVQLPLP